MSESSEPNSSSGTASRDVWRPSLIWTTVKLVAVVAGLSWLAANWVSSTDREGLARLAGLAGKGTVEEPSTTGSIAKRANSTKLDPCAMPRR